MHSDDIAFENELAGCKPRRLDDRLLDRLSAALATDTEPAVDVDFERMLCSQSPAALSDTLMARLVPLVDETPNLVPMPVPVERVIPFRRYAAAAAIAIAGALAALVAPIHEGGTREVADREAPISSGSLTADTRHFVPAAYERGLSEACDEGTIWKDNMPHRVLRIVYMDTITLRSEAGETVEVEKPCVEYIVIPNSVRE